MKHKLLSILLSLLFVLLSLTACGNTKENVPEPTLSPNPTETEVPEITPVPGNDNASDTAPDKFRIGYEKFSPDTTVMYVDGVEIKWCDFYSWIYNAAYQIDSNYDVQDWSDEFAAVVGRIENPTYGNYTLSYAFTNAMQCAVIANRAKERNITISEEQQAELDSNTMSYIATYGGEDGYIGALEDHYLTREYFEFQNEISVLYTNLFLDLFGEDACKVSDEDALAFLRENGYLHAKHILFSTIDDSYNQLSESEIKEKRDTAEQILEELRSCSPEELAERFDFYMQEFSEDPGSASYPDGYYFLPGEMVPEFENAVLSLAENEVSDIVESDYGFHIILNPVMSPDHIMGYSEYYEPYTARTVAAVDFFDQATSDWYENATVLYANGFEALDLNELFA